MAQKLDLADLQGNILRAYGRQGFPKARYLFLHIADETAGRAFVETLRPRITTAVRWQSKANYPGEVIVDRPKVAINIGFTFYGLLALGLPTTTLRGLPPEFIDGMGARADILGDLGPDGDHKWDPIWENNKIGDGHVHALITLNAQMNPDGTPVEDLEAVTRWLQDECAKLGNKVRIVAGHGLDGKGLWQDASALLEPDSTGALQPTAKEHFGFTDGFGDPVFDGQYSGEMEDLRAIGGGAINPDQTWRPLATGEFLLGYPDEAQEIPGESLPFDFSRNGTFMAYRKLHQNVKSFADYIRDSAAVYAKAMNVPQDEAEQTLMAKIAGRWADGVPLMAAPTFADWKAFQAKEQAQEKLEKVGHHKRQENSLERQLVDFKYASDPDGVKCPLSSHLRRVNPRDMLDPTFRPGQPGTWSGSVLNNRRRILRRGLPYGPMKLEQGQNDNGEHGIVFLAVCSSLFRQFEFVQQQWIQYGLDFNSGNDTCPLIGNHGKGAKFVIPSSVESGEPPFIAANIPQLVEVRGGDYFFIPSMTALRMIGMGIVDPT
jgi:deferrochelatase/peroxidase EfeB